MAEGAVVGARLGMCSFFSLFLAGGGEVAGILGRRYRERDTEHMTGFLVFDLETMGLFSDQFADEVPGAVYTEDAPPPILCASVQILRPAPVQAPGSVGFHCEPVLSWHCPDLGDPANRPWTMQWEEIASLVDFMHDLAFPSGEGTLPVLPLGWNSLGFDFRVLFAHARVAEDEPRADKLLRLTAVHVDPMFNFFMARGHPVGLQKVSEGFKLAGKTGSGKDVGERWTGGEEPDRWSVVRYCEADVAATAQVVSCVAARGCVAWITQKNQLRMWTDPRLVLLSVERSMELPEPNNSWMSSDPPTVDSFAKWYKRAINPKLAESNRC